MNIHAQKRAKHYIRGYFLPTANENQNKAFERARSETIKNLKVALQEVEKLDKESFFNHKI